MARSVRATADVVAVWTYGESANPGEELDSWSIKFGRKWQEHRLENSTTEEID